ncbi:hypothetical protein F4825DRAFT_363062 [Nemania diffusa]|nr:hypothetical protein F4825DRAFT_363062 [Nemania diffusa]
MQFYSLALGLISQVEYLFAHEYVYSPSPFSGSAHSNRYNRRIPSPQPQEEQTASQSLGVHSCMMDDIYYPVYPKRP